MHYSTNNVVCFPAEEVDSNPGQTSCPHWECLKRLAAWVGNHMVHKAVEHRTTYFVKALQAVAEMLVE